MLNRIIDFHPDIFYFEFSKNILAKIYFGSLIFCQKKFLVILNSRQIYHQSFMDALSKKV